MGGESKGIEAYLLAPGHYMSLYFTLYDSQCNRADELRLQWIKTHYNGPFCSALPYRVRHLSAFKLCVTIAMSLLYRYRQLAARRSRRTSSPLVHPSSSCPPSPKPTRTILTSRPEPGVALVTLNLPVRRTEWCAAFCWCRQGNRRHFHHWLAEGFCRCVLRAHRSVTYSELYRNSNAGFDAGADIKEMKDKTCE